MEIIIKRTDWNNIYFQNLVFELDKELAIRDGNDHSFYSQFNKIQNINHCIVAFEADLPIACGAIKFYNQDTVEVKRMFVPMDWRGKGIASRVLLELEIWAKELGYKKCLLETGLKQPEAIALYQKANYSKIPNYGQYSGVENSVCFQKDL